MALILQMTWQNQRRRKTPIGLRNLGNTCYLNSVLQCLTYTPPLAQFCLSKQHSSTCKSLKECAFCILERQIARSLTLEGSIVDSPIKIQKCIAQLAENFRLGRQEDAHEFLRYVIDACHNTCSRLTKKISGSPSSCNGGSVEPTSVMNEIFGGALLSQVKCLSCKGESNKTDDILDISLDIFQTNSLKDAFGRFFQPEILDGNNKYDCSKCKKLCVAKKQMFVLRAPNVLVIQFKRFEGIYSGKINKNIEFEEVLSLSKFMCSTTKDYQPEYSLIGTIVHSGISPDSGHYYAYVKDPSGRWYCCNDSQVSLSSTQEVLSEKVYILFYLRNSQSPKHIKNTSPCTFKAPCPGSTELSNMRSNGLSSLKNNSSSITMNGNKSTASQMKFNNIKNPDTKKPISNGNGNHLANTNGSIEKNIDRKLTPAGKENATPPLNGSLNNPKSENKVILPSFKIRVESGKKKILHVANGNVCYNQDEVKELEDGSTQKISAVNKELSHVNSSSNMHLKKVNNTATLLKRKSCDDGKDEELEGSVDNPTISSQIDAPCKTPILCEGNRCKELERFKEIITSEAISTLRSCGWVDNVHNFMHARKKICTQTAGRTWDSTELRKQLKVDAKPFVTQIPESLKEHLIEQLRSFSNR